jgi:hypothetical protein
MRVYFYKLYCKERRKVKQDTWRGIPLSKGNVDSLREYGFKVETCVIGEPLQSALEKQHCEYIKCLTNADVYYDPKELDQSNIGRAYNEVIEWIQKNNAWDIAKAGWKSMKKLHPGV